MKNEPEFKIIRVNSLTTYALTIPDNEEGKDLLSDIRDMLLDVGYSELAARISLVTENLAVNTGIFNKPTPAYKRRKIR